MIPDWLPADAWTDYLAMRKAMKKVPTERAIDLLIMRLAAMAEEGQNVRAVLEQSIMHNWIGVFEVHEARRSVSRQAPASQKFNFANVDRAGDAAAQAASMLKHRITATDSEVEF